jgi:hypothetical protein
MLPCIALDQSTGILELSIADEKKFYLSEQDTETNAFLRYVESVDECFGVDGTRWQKRAKTFSKDKLGAGVKNLCTVSSGTHHSIAAGTYQTIEQWLQVCSLTIPSKQGQEPLNMHVEHFPVSHLGSRKSRSYHSSCMFPNFPVIRYDSRTCHCHCWSTDGSNTKLFMLK